MMCASSGRLVGPSLDVDDTRTHTRRGAREGEMDTAVVVSEGPEAGGANPRPIDRRGEARSPYVSPVYYHDRLSEVMLRLTTVTYRLGHRFKYTFLPIDEAVSSRGTYHVSGSDGWADGRTGGRTGGNAFGASLITHKR